MKPYLIIFTLLLTSQVFASTWIFESNSKGIKTYSKTEKSSSIKTFMAVGYVQAPVEKIGLILLDVNNHYKWIAGVKYSKLKRRYYGDFSNLSTIKKGGFQQYYVINTPWPVQNRDVIIRTDFTINWKKGIIHVACKAQQLPGHYKNSKYFRMTRTNIYWKCYSVKKNLTRVVYIIRTDPGGSIPASFANNTAKNMPLTTILNLKKQCKKSGYQKQYKKLFNK